MITKVSPHLVRPGDIALNETTGRRFRVQSSFAKPLPSFGEVWNIYLVPLHPGDPVHWSYPPGHQTNRSWDVSIVEFSREDPSQSIEELKELCQTSQNH